MSALLSGLGLLVTGTGLVLRRARLFGLGLIPPLITSVLFVVLFVTASWLSQRIAVWLTPFAEGWAGVETLRTAALADEDGAALDRAIAAMAPVPLPAHAA